MGFLPSIPYWNVLGRRLMRVGPLLVIAVLLVILWAGSFLLFHIASAFIHILLLLALILFVVHIFSPSKSS